MQEITRHVLITGASSGIGYSTAVELASQDFLVYAGVRSEKDKNRLLSLNNPLIQPIILDVTNPQHINDAFELIDSQTKECGLYALINNAGVNYTSPFEYTVEAKARQMMEVNFFGLYLLSQKMLPLLRRFNEFNNDYNAKLINIGSIGSSVGIPWESFYHASKFALFGLSESLRSELHKLRVDVTIVMPGGIKTEFFGKTDTQSLEALQNLPSDAPQFYFKAMEKYNKLAKRVGSITISSEIAARRIVSLTKKKKAPFIWLIGVDAKSLYIVQKFAPRWILHWIFSNAI